MEIELFYDVGILEQRGISIINHCKYDRFFEPKSSDIVVDAGAHVGVYSLKATK
jgi:hypothetical protein